MIKDKATKRIKMQMIYTAALYNIICAMKKHRIFDRFGFDVPKPDTEKITKVAKLIIFNEWVYSCKQTDWLCIDTDLPLTGYKPSAKLEAMLEHYINKVLE